MNQKKPIQSHRDLEVYQLAFEVAMQIFELSSWIEFAVESNYLEVEQGRELYRNYNKILGMLVNMINNPSPWLMKH